MPFGFAAVSAYCDGRLPVTLSPCQEFRFMPQALTLFGLGGVVSGRVPTELQIARILGPIITGYAAIQGLLALSREQAQLIWFRLFLRRHVIVAGLGSIGFRL